MGANPNTAATGQPAATSEPTHVAAAALPREADTDMPDAAPVAAAGQLPAAGAAADVPALPTSMLPVDPGQRWWYEVNLTVAYVVLSARPPRPLLVNKSTGKMSTSHALHIMDALLIQCCKSCLHLA